MKKITTKTNLANRKPTSGVDHMLRMGSEGPVTFTDGSGRRWYGEEAVARIPEPQRAAYRQMMDDWYDNPDDGYYCAADDETVK